MIQLIDFQTIKESSDSQEELSLILRQLIGQPFLFFRVSYGDELTIHLGEPREYSHPRMKRRLKGSSILSARASAWYFRSDLQPVMYTSGGDSMADGGLVSRKLEVREFESQHLVREGSVVVRVEILPSSAGFGLALAFTDRSTLMILPESSPHSTEAKGDDDQEEVDLADWELFTPYHRYLRVGPGLRWAYLADDKPTSA